MYKPTKELLYVAKSILKDGYYSRLRNTIYSTYGGIGCGIVKYIRASETKDKQVLHCWKKCDKCRDCYMAVAKDILSKYHPKIKVV